MSETRSEWGTSGNVRFPDPTQVKMYDREGKEVSNPICSVCNAYKQCVIGKTCYTWICTNGCKNG